LFDPNPHIKLNDFNHYCWGISNKSTKKNYYYNSFFPSSGSGFNKITMNDFFWNLSRKIITFQIFKKFSKFQVRTISLDNFCKKKNYYNRIVKNRYRRSWISSITEWKKIIE
jgi:hypothetical protein